MSVNRITGIFYAGVPHTVELESFPCRLLGNKSRMKGENCNHTFYLHTQIVCRIHYNNGHNKNTLFYRGYGGGYRAIIQQCCYILHLIPNRINL